MMPRLNALAKGGVRGVRHHAVFPTVTRVNSPSIFTGANPGSHVLLGNTLYIPAADPERLLSAASVPDFRRMKAAAAGRLLDGHSVGELLEASGRVFFAASSGSQGSAPLMNPRGAGAGLVHHAFSLPDTLQATADAMLGRLRTRSAGTPRQRPARAPWRDATHLYVNRLTSHQHSVSRHTESTPNAPSFWPTLLPAEPNASPPSPEPENLA